MLKQSLLQELETRCGVRFVLDLFADRAGHTALCLQWRYALSRTFSFRSRARPKRCFGEFVGRFRFDFVLHQRRKEDRTRENENKTRTKNIVWVEPTVRQARGVATRAPPPRRRAGPLGPRTALRSRRAPGRPLTPCPTLVSRRGPTSVSVPSRLPIPTPVLPYQVEFRAAFNYGITY